MVWKIISQAHKNSFSHLAYQIWKQTLYFRRSLGRTNRCIHLWRSVIEEPTRIAKIIPNSWKHVGFPGASMKIITSSKWPSSKLGIPVSTLTTLWNKQKQPVALKSMNPSMRWFRWEQKVNQVSVLKTKFNERCIKMQNISYESNRNKIELNKWIAFEYPKYNLYT